jgi:hypothetical protein
MHASLRSKSIEWLILNVSQWNNVSIHVACSIKEDATWIDTLFHWDIFRANHSILFLLNAACYMDRHVVPLGHIQNGWL